jgi:hypothetical protein
VFEALEECLRTGIYGSESEAIEVLTGRRDKLLSLDVINNSTDLHPESESEEPDSP